MTPALTLALSLLAGCTETPPPATVTPPPHTPPTPDRRPPGPPSQPKGLKVTPTLELLGEPAAQPRSIVVISLDTVRADRLAVYGGRAETPTLSALAARGAVLEQAISHFPETAMSHWAMLSGVLPELHGNVPANRGSRYTGPTLAEIAHHSGYTTGAFVGGVTLTDQSCGLSRGFDVYDDQFRLDPQDMRRPGAEVTRNAANWIRFSQQQQRPFFAFVHYFDAHFPYTPASPWDTRYDPDYTGTLTGSDAALRPYRDGEKVPSAEDVAHVLALYDGELSELDALIAPLIEAAGPDTLIIVTADHGESFEHDYYFNHRAGLWDGVTHVPWIMAGPGVPAGVRVAGQVGLIDVTPTALDLAGLPLDARMQGRSRKDLLAGPTLPGAEEVYSITDPWMPDPQFAARTPDHKRIEQSRGGGTILTYDLRADPEETRPDAAVPETLQGARERYGALIKGLLPQQASATNQAVPYSPEECAHLEALGYTTCQ